MTSADQERGTRGSFPALDPEPLHHPWSRRLSIPVVLLVAAVVVAVVVFRPGSAGGGRRAKSAAMRASLVVAGGRVVVETSAGGIAAVDPNGDHLIRVSRVVLTTTAFPVASPDGRLISLGNGGLLSFDGPGGSVIEGSLPATVPSLMTVGGFADRGRAVVVVGLGDPLSSALVSVVSLGHDGGPPVALGVGDTAVGDPRALGAFVSVPFVGDSPVGVQQAPGNLSEKQLLADGEVDLRDAAKPPVVLATAAQINADLGQDPSSPISLQLAPDRTGARLAVAAVPADGSGSAGVVVLDRVGHLLGTVAPARGPRDAAAPVWSPDGRSLVYPGFGNSGPDVTVWRLGAPVVSRVIPDPSDSLGGCLWSPDGSTVLCLAYGSSGGTSTWLILRVRGGPILSVPGAGVPLAWLRAGGG